MIREFMQSLVAAEVARQVAELEQRQLAAARVERRPGSWPLATSDLELSLMLSDGRLTDVAPVARSLVRRVVDNSPAGWGLVSCPIQCPVYVSAQAAEAVSKTCDPAVSLRSLLLDVGGLLERAGAASARVQPTRHNPKFPSVLARQEGVEVLAQVCPRPDGSTFVVVHARDEVCPVWHDPEERFP